MFRTEEQINKNLPYSILTVNQPIRLIWLRSASLPCGKYYFQGDLRQHVARGYDWRCQQAGLYTLEFIEPANLLAPTISAAETVINSAPQVAQSIMPETSSMIWPLPPRAAPGELGTILKTVAEAIAKHDAISQPVAIVAAPVTEVATKVIETVPVVPAVTEPVAEIETKVTEVKLEAPPGEVKESVYNNPTAETAKIEKPKRGRPPKVPSI